MDQHANKQLNGRGKYEPLPFFAGGSAWRRRIRMRKHRAGLTQGDGDPAADAALVGLFARK